MDARAMGQSRKQILSVLGDHKPKSLREIVKATGISESAAYNALAACWKKGLVQRTKKPIYEFEKIFKDRAGMTQTTRPYHLYVLRPEGADWQCTISLWRLLDSQAQTYYIERTVNLTYILQC